ncbi:MULTISPECIES: ion transporter [unclassified Streptomyces]|uniref:ion transporter n=1 Tax=unclassified Streptomyces TaxID=2593676 RepID=UPI00081B401B|nr:MULTISPECIES: ion transporter [unclassified Streptomyces]MYX75726.1 ion transporter [Streptomyces sp. SID3915]SCD35887.1 voltage-gated sodium channel [Streptomyces sp. BpilaLS-43]
MPEQYDQRTAVESRPGRPELARRCRRVTEARWFAVTVLTVILLNAALLGLETYSGLVEEWHRWLRLAEHGCLAVFTAEILVRLGAHADRPRGFLKDPWNLFDLAVVLCAFLPLVRENTTVLRLLRLARVLRTARFLPQLRIVLVAVGRSLPGTLSFLLVGALLLYVYAMVGWVFFGRQDPEHYGSIGRAVLTLFLLMILDGIGDAIHAGLEISRWSLLYYASYVLLASFVLVNVLIGVVITSLEEAREMEEEQDARDTAAEPSPSPPQEPGRPEEDDRRLLLERLAAARQALDALERDLVGTPPPLAGATSTPPTTGARP